MNESIPKVSISIVTWNSRRFMPGCLDSIHGQTLGDFSILAIDNDSQDKTAQLLEEKYPEIKVIRNSRNLGFAKAHNQGIRFSKSEYVLVANPDIVMEPDCLAEMVAAMDADKKLGSVGCKLLRMKAESTDLDRTYGEKTDLIDSAGLSMRRSRKAIDRGQGEKDAGQYDRQEEVFGITGALVLYRRQALEDAVYEGEYFDGDFSSYKEDVDLAWRMRLLGWKSLYVPSAVSYHFRAVGSGSDPSIGDVVRSRRSQPKLIRYYSYRNHLMCLAKNLLGRNFLRDFFYIMGYELKKLGYFIIFERSSLKGLVHFLAKLPKILKKRKALMRRLRVRPEEMRKWFLKPNR